MLVVCSIARAAPGEVLEADGTLQWRRGNMHTHSLWSDGDDYLEMIALWYRKRDYNFLVFTDHNVLADHERWIDVRKSKGGLEAYEKFKARFPEAVLERRNAKDELEVRLSTFQEVAAKMNAPGEFLLIQGEEISDFYQNLPIHLNVSNIAELIPPMHGRSVLDTIQSNVRAAQAQRERTGQPMIVHLNHPNFGYAVTAEDLAQVIGERFFEVYNGHPGVNNSGDENHVGTERMWDIVLTLRLGELDLPIMYGLATDDGHEYHNVPSRASEPGRGWVMVLTDQLSTEALIEALEAGRYYASSGVALKRIETTADSYSVEVKPKEDETYTIEFVGTRRGYDDSSEAVVDAEGKSLRATRRYSSDLGAVLLTVEGPTATYQFTGDELYVRARITSSALHPNPSERGEHQRAWCQPVVVTSGSGKQSP